MRADPYAIGSSSLDKLPPKRAIPQAPSQLSAPVLDSLQYPPEQTTRTCIIAGNYLSAICHEMYARTQSYVCVVGKVEGGRPGYVRCGELAQSRCAHRHRTRPSSRSGDSQS